MASPIFAGFIENFCTDILGNGATIMKLPEELQFIKNSRMVQKTTDVRLNDRVCVITGATSGVGYHAAKRLSQGGAHLILVCRNPEKATRVQNELIHKNGTPVQILLADFSRFSEVRETAAALLENYPRIHLLINNAGIHNTRRIVTEFGIEIVFSLNHLASFLFTRLLLSRMIESAPARIIQVNSQGHRFGGLDLNDLNWEKRRYRGLKGYGASKTAQLLTVWELADRLHGSGVTINAMHPGAVKTDTGQENGAVYRWYKKNFIDKTLRSPEISAEALYYLGVSKEIEGVSGKFFNLTAKEEPAPPALDREVAYELWEKSLELAGLSSRKK